jgi:predicted GTPase
MKMDTSEPVKIYAVSVTLNYAYASWMIAARNSDEAVSLFEGGKWVMATNDPVEMKRRSDHNKRSCRKDWYVEILGINSIKDMGFANPGVPPGHVYSSWQSQLYDH